MKRALFVSAALASLAACGGDFAGSPGGDFGATQGGVQDLGLARELIAAGIIPPPEAFPVEGMFSEHDLPLEGPACETLLCLRGALGVAPTLDGESAAWLQIGMSSTINPETFERPSQTLIMTVDVSGSMGWTYEAIDDEGSSPGQLARELLGRLGTELGPDDRVAVVTFGSDVSTRLSLTAGNDPAYASLVDDLDTAGSTNMEAGLRRAYAIAADAVDEGATNEVRVVLFTDVQPNTGASTASEFDELVRDGAAIGAGLTVFALGAGMGQEVLRAIADVRGGNAFSLFRLADVDKLMENDWPFFASPIAYDLTLALETGTELEVGEAYGFPSDSPKQIQAATVFLSRRRGALLTRFVPQGDFDLAAAGFTIDGSLRYTTPEGAPITEGLSATFDPATLTDGRGFQQASVEKTVALAILTRAMADATTEVRDGDRDAAVELMDLAIARYEADIANFENADLERELALSTALRQLIADGAPQDSPYGF